MDPLDFTLDKTDILDRCDHDPELLALIIQEFLNELPERVLQIRAALGKGDGSALERAAHALKGSAANFSNSPVVESCLRLQILGAEGKLADALPVYLALETSLGRFTELLRAIGEKKLPIP